MHPANLASHWCHQRLRGSCSTGTGTGEPIDTNPGQDYIPMVKVWVSCSGKLMARSRLIHTLVIIPLIVVGWTGKDFINPCKKTNRRIGQEKCHALGPTGVSNDMRYLVQDCHYVRYTCSINSGRCTRPIRSVRVIEIEHIEKRRDDRQWKVWVPCFYMLLSIIPGGPFGDLYVRSIWAILHSIMKHTKEPQSPPCKTTIVQCQSDAPDEINGSMDVTIFIVPQGKHEFVSNLIIIWALSHEL